MPYNPELNLRTALALVDEVIDETEPFRDHIDTRNASLQSSSERGFLKETVQIFKEEFALSNEGNALVQKCEQALSLASSVKPTHPDLVVRREQNGIESEYSPDRIMSLAHLCKGVVLSLSNQLMSAHESFLSSLTLYPTPDASLRLAYTSLVTGERDISIQAFEKVVADYPESEEAVEAKKVILQLESLKPKKWVVALTLSIFLGVWGVDRFYLGYVKDGFIKLFSGGGIGIWWAWDILKISLNSLRDMNGLKLVKASNSNIQAMCIASAAIFLFALFAFLVAPK